MFCYKSVLSNDLPKALTYWPQYDMSALGKTNPIPVKCRICLICTAWRGAEQKKAIQAVNAMPCKYSRQNRDYEYIQVTWGTPK